MSNNLSNNLRVSRCLIREQDSRAISDYIGLFISFVLIFAQLIACCFDKLSRRFFHIQAESNTEEEVSMMLKQTDPAVDIALNALGLSADEAIVYQVLLGLGLRPASVVAQRAKLKRSHTYNILSALGEKGIVQEVEKNSVRHFTASPPAALTSVLERQILDLQSRRKKVEEALPRLEAMESKSPLQPKVRFFRGAEGIKEMFEDILRTNCTELVSLVDLKYSWSSHPDTSYWIRDFIARREKMGMLWRAIAVRSPESDKELRARSAALREVRLVEELNLPAEVNIYGNKVALTSTFHEMIGVIIESEPIAETIRAVHSLIWRSLKPEDQPLQDAPQKLVVNG